MEMTPGIYLSASLMVLEDQHISPRILTGRSKLQSQRCAPLQSVAEAALKSCSWVRHIQKIWEEWAANHKDRQTCLLSLALEAAVYCFFFFADTGPVMHFPLLLGFNIDLVS